MNNFFVHTIRLVLTVALLSDPAGATGSQQIQTHNSLRNQLVLSRMAQEALAGRETSPYIPDNLNRHAFQLQFKPLKATLPLGISRKGPTGQRIDEVRLLLKKALEDPVTNKTLIEGYLAKLRELVTAKGPKEDKEYFREVVGESIALWLEGKPAAGMLEEAVTRLLARFGVGHLRCTFRGRSALFRRCPRNSSRISRVRGS